MVAAAATQRADLKAPKLAKGKVRQRVAGEYDLRQGLTGKRRGKPVWPAVQSIHAYPLAEFRAKLGAEAFERIASKIDCCRARHLVAGLMALFRC